MIFESKTGFSEGSISLDKVSEERQLLAGEGGSKSREFVLRGLYIGLTYFLTTPDLTCVATNGPCSLGVAMATPPEPEPFSLTQLHSGIGKKVRKSYKAYP